MNSFESLTQTLAPARETAPIDWRVLESLRPGPEADDGFEILLLSKLFFARTAVTRAQFLQALDDRQRTGLSIEHLLVRDGHCAVKEALGVVAERRRILQLIHQEPGPWVFTSRS